MGSLNLLPAVNAAKIFYNKICIFRVKYLYLRPYNYFFYFMKYCLLLAVALLYNVALLLAQPTSHVPHNQLRSQQELLDVLDETISQRQHYIDVRLQEIDVLKNRLSEVTSPMERMSLCSALYNRYGSLNNDSAFVYAERAYALAQEHGQNIHQQHASIDLAYCYCLSGLYDEGYRLMPTRQEVLPEVLLDYYIAQCSFLQWQSEFTTIPKLKAERLSQSMCYHDSILLTDTNPLHQLQERAQIEGMLTRDEALAQLEHAIDSLPASEDYIRYMALMVGRIFEARQQPDSAIVYYTISAISDMQHGILEHASLQRVAALLFEQGSVERAYRYMDCCLKDAHQSRARLRALELQENLDVIMAAYNGQLLHSQQRLRLMLIVTLVMLVVVIIVSFWLNKLRRHLKRRSCELMTTHEALKQSHQQLEVAMNEVNAINRQLEQANRSLQESNRIKDSFVTQYMKQCREGISHLQGYQQKLLRLVMTHSTELLEETIRNTENLEPEMEAFYGNFDETFLSLYPDFVEQLNALLRPEERYAVTPHLPTELRVFALMRLGVTDLDEIADFLRCASKTVLNYRSRIRQKALIDKEELDRWITTGAM